MNDFKDEYTGSAPMGPENHHLASGLHCSIHLPKDLHDFVLRKMLDHSEVVSAVESLPCYIRKIENIAVPNGFSARIVASVGFKRRQRDIDCGYAHIAGKIGVDLP